MLIYLSDHVCDNAYCTNSFLAFRQLAAGCVKFVFEWCCVVFAMLEQVALAEDVPVQPAHIQAPHLLAVSKLAKTARSPPFLCTMRSTSIRSIDKNIGTRLATTSFALLSRAF